MYTEYSVAWICGCIEEGWKQKAQQRSSRRFEVQNLFNSLLRYSCLAQVCLEETVEFSRSVGKKRLNKPFLSLNSTPGMMFIVIKQAKKAPVQSFPFISLKGTVYQKIKRVVNSKLRTANLPNSNVPSQTKQYYSSRLYNFPFRKHKISEFRSRSKNTININYQYISRTMTEQ